MKIQSVRHHILHAKVKIQHGTNSLSRKIANLEPGEIIAKSKASLHSLKELKGRAKLVLVGHLLMAMDSVASVTKQLAKAIAESIATGSSQSAGFTLAGTVLGSFSIGVQVIATSLDAVKLHSLRKQAKKFNEAVKNNTVSEYLVDKAQKSKGLRKVLNPITKNQTQRIATIFSSSQEEIKNTVIGKIEKRFSHLQKMKGIGIALGVIAAVGLVLMTFAPTPLAPVAWGILGTAMALTAVHVIEGFVADYRFSKFTKLQAKKIDEMGVELDTFT
jgi:hypothetical protein